MPFFLFGKNSRNIYTMPQVVRTDSDDLNTQLVLTLKKEHYEPKFRSELNKYRGKVSMKGFRKGKTPTALIRKMYGKSILVDVINEMVQHEIFDYIKKEGLQTIGQPIPAENQPLLDFDVVTLQDMEFRFDVGLAPKFELKGVSKDSKFDFLKVQISDEFLNQQVEDGRKRVGERATVTDSIEGNDVVKMNVEELDGDAIKENGWAATFSVLVDDIADEAVKADFLSKKAGDKVRFNVFELEADRDVDFVRKHILNIQENDGDVEVGEMFEGTIEEVNRVGLAELNQDFFDKYMGPGKVSSVEEMKKLIEDDYVKHYDKQADALMNRDFNDMLIEQNELSLPDEFLKRWLKYSEENVNPQDIEDGYDDFAKSLRWSLIRGELIKKFNLEVSEEETFEGLKENVRGMFKQYGMPVSDELIILNTANKMAEDKEQMNKIYSEMMTVKVFEAVKEAITIDEKPISREDFDELLSAERIKMENQEVAKTARAEEVVIEEIEGSDEEITEGVEEW